MVSDAFHERYAEALSLHGDGVYDAFVEVRSRTEGLAFVLVWAQRQLKRLFWELVLIMGGLALLVKLAT